MAQQMKMLKLGQITIAHDGTKVQANASKHSAVLADSGYYSQQAVETIEQHDPRESSGTIVYAAVEKTGHHRTVEDLERKEDPPAPSAEAGSKEIMQHRLKTKAGKALYHLRKQTVEPVFGIIKQTMGFRRFSLRGKAKAALEWTLVTLSYNLRRIYSVQQRTHAPLPLNSAETKARAHGLAAGLNPKWLSPQTLNVPSLPRTLAVALHRRLLPTT
jgi:hypothetical protein